MNNRQKKMCMCSVVVVLLIIFMVLRRESYKLSPTPIQTTGGSTGSLFDLPYKLECVPGPTAQSSYYTTGLNPGGICGAQKQVEASTNYQITGGVGGSLISPA